MEIKFKPWIGDNYQQGISGRKVLVLGESHYCANPADATSFITVEVISDLLNPASGFEAYKNTYTKFAKALSGKTGNMSAAEKSQLWHSVAFYNYVQEPITGPRTSPAEAQFKRSEQAFKEVLEALNPDVVIVWGHRLYNHLPGYGNQGPDISGPDGATFETWVYPFSNGTEARVLGIDHPSTGFTPEYWHNVISRFITL